MLRRCSSLISLCLCVSLGKVAAQSEPAAIIELGSANRWNPKDGGSSVGPDFAVEITPIKNSVEIECSVTRLFSRYSTEWDAGLLFKKPWALSKKVEFEIGIGPAWVHSKQFGTTNNSVAGEAVLHFMFWPFRKRKFGWFMESGYEYNFGRGHERAIGMSAGLAIGIP